MSEKQMNPTLKTVLEMGPVVIFFVVYILYKDSEFTLWGETYSGFLLATALFIPMILFTTAVFWFMTGTVSRMQAVTAVLVVLFGGLGLWFNDDRFFKMKPTAIYLIMAGVLGFGLLRGDSYLKFVMAEVLPMDDEGWMKLTKRFFAFFVFLAVLNEVVWRGFSTDIWVNFKTFGLMILFFAFMLSQSGLLKQHMIEEEDDLECDW